MTFYLLDKMGVPAEDIAPVIRAIGNHDEGSGVPVSDIAAAVTSSMLKINQEHTAIKLKLEIDTRYGEIGEYFEIFMERMLLCRNGREEVGRRKRRISFAFFENRAD